MINPSLWSSYEKPWSCSKFISSFSSFCLSISISVSLLTSSLPWPRLHWNSFHWSLPASATPIASFLVFMNPHCRKKIHSQAIIILLETVINYACNIPSSITFFSFLMLSRAFSKLIFYHSVSWDLLSPATPSHFLAPLHSHPGISYSFHKSQSNWKSILHHTMCSEIKTRRFYSKRYIHKTSLPHYKASCHPPHHCLKFVLGFFLVFFKLLYSKIYS